MPRYIEEDAIRQGKFHLNYLIPDGDKDDSYWYQLGWNGAIDIVLDCLPKVEAEPVVRCKDCKHYNEYSSGFGSCEIHKGSIAIQTPFTFCAWAERREDAID